METILTKKLPIIQSLWIGEELGKMEVLSIRSFLSHGHEYHLYLYDNVKNIPDGVTIKNAEEIIPRDKIFYIANSYAGFSNTFRYKLLLEKAGFWVDTDVVCLKPFLFDTPYILATERVKKNSQEVKIASCVLGVVETNTELMDFCLEKASQVDLNNYQWGMIGPNLVTRAVNELKLQSYIYSPNAFCPIDWWDWSLYVKPGIQLKTDHPYALHLWHQAWKVHGVDKNLSFPNTLYEHLYTKYDISIA